MIHLSSVPVSCEEGHGTSLNTRPYLWDIVHVYRVVVGHTDSNLLHSSLHLSETAMCGVV